MTPDADAPIPRFAEVAAQLAENGYEPLPVHFGRKNPSAGAQWQRYQFAEADLERFADAGTGIICGRVVGIDIDVRDAALANEIEALAEEFFGPAPRRIGQAPKVLRLYQAERPFEKIQTRGYKLPGESAETKAHRVEILARGQQFVAFNLHPDTGRPYTWNGAGDPLTVPIGLLATVSETHAREFIAAAEKILSRRGRAVGKLTQQDDTRTREPNEEQRAADPDLLRRALEALPNDDLEFDDWIRVLYAVKGALDDAGLKDFLRWSSKSLKHDPTFSIREYNAARPTKLGAGTVYYLANIHGWKRPSTAEANSARTDIPKCAPIDWDELIGDPPPRIWWLPDWLGPGPLLTAGAGGVGKTKLWQCIGTALATSTRYFEEPTGKPLRFLMWQCEESREDVWRTQTSINAHLGVTMADLALLNIVPRLGFDNTLLTISFGQPSFTPLLEQLREQVNDLKIDVLVLDNLAQLFGGDERNRHQVTYFVNGVLGLVRDRPFAPVFVGHVARSEGSEYSGSAAWENAVRMRWYLGPTLPDQEPVDSDESPISDFVYLAKRKANYAPKDWRRFRFQSGVFVPDEPADGRRFDQAYRDEAAESVLLQAFPKLQEAGILPTDAKNSPDYLPAKTVSLGYHQGHTKKELASAMNRLMGAGRLRREVVGKYSSNRNPRHGLVIV